MNQDNLQIDMKRIVFLTAALALLVSGCKEQKPVIPVTDISLSPTEATMKEGGEPLHLTVTVLPEDADDRTVVWQSSDTKVATVADGTVTAVSDGSADITASAGGKTATCHITVLAGFKAVDLGLSVQWANMDLGADEVGDYGRYYAWGEVEADRSNYVQETYKWGDYSSLSKYLPILYNGRQDEKALLDEEDDAAHAELGGEWRIPTSEEVSELYATLENENYSWSMTEVNGHVCRKITYLVNGNSILLPFSGYKFRTGVQAVGAHHFSWAADCVASSAYLAYVMHSFAPSRAGVDIEGASTRSRWEGCTIRPVKGSRRIPLSSLTLDPHDIALAENTKYTPTVNLWPDNAGDKTLKWESDVPDVASADANGTITAHKSGYTSIWCRHGALWTVINVEVAPFGYGIYIKNELGWDKIWMVARIIDKPAFTGTPGLEPAGERDGYLYFPLDITMMDQELRYKFIDDKGNSTEEFRKANYTKRIIYQTLN